MQPSSGYQYNAVAGGTAASTTVLKSTNAVLQSIIIPGTYVGSLVFFDSATAAGTATTNQVLALGLPATAVPASLLIEAEFRNGLTYTASGTPTVTVIWN
jgi:hypothetical protein